MDYQKYFDFTRELDETYLEKGLYDDVIRCVRAARDSLTGFEFELTVYELMSRRNQGRDEDCMDILEQGIAKGWFFSLYFPSWERFRKYDRYRDIERRNTAVKEKVQAAARPEMTVKVPSGFDSGRKWPLFVNLHGDGMGSSMAFHLHEWPPETLQKSGYVVCYLQSSQVSCTNAFGWTRNYPLTRNEITAAITKLCADYPIDRDNIIVGGFSGGAMAALNFTLCGETPHRGIMALCPDPFDGLTVENAARVVARGTKLVVLEGSQSGDTDTLKNIREVFGKGGLSYLERTNPGIGHSVPVDTEPMIADALAFISPSAS